MISQGQTDRPILSAAPTAPYLSGYLDPFSLCVTLCVYTPLTLQFSYGLP